MNIQIKLLIGTWLHSHEEDTATERIYRRSDFEFPPSRGRRGYEFQSDHSCISIGIAARDGATKEACKWQLHKATESIIVLTFPDGHQNMLQIVSVNSKCLVIKKT